MSAALRRARVPAGTALLLCALASGACGGRLPSGPGRFGDDRKQTAADLLAAQARWRAQGLSSYSFRFERSCFCANRQPVVVQVRAGRVASVVGADSGAPVAAEELPLYKSVDGLFADLQAAVDQPADTIRARYDERLGFPADVYIDQSAQIADEEYGYTVDQLER